MVPPIHRLLSFTAVVAVVAVSLCSRSGQAALIFAESFSYPDGDLSGGPPAGSPTGQTGWTKLAYFPQVTSPGLSHPGIVDMGGKATVTGFANGERDTAGAFLSPAGGGAATVWIAVLASNGGTSTTGYALVSAYNVAASTYSTVGLIGSGFYGIGINDAAQTSANTTTQPGSAATLLVAKLDFQTGKEYLFVNPSTAAEPAVATANATLAMEPTFKNAGFDRLILVAGDRADPFSFDELRVGTTYPDVVPGATVLPGTPATVPGKPTVSLKGKVKRTNTKSRLVLKGSATNAARVEVKVGKSTYRPARTKDRWATWSYSAKLAPGKNKILVHAVGADDSASRPLKIKTTRE